MAKPPISLRVPDQTQQRVASYALERGIPRNAAYVELLDRGLAMIRSPNSLAPVPPIPRPPADPIRQAVSSNPVQLGPTRQAPGARLKTKP